MSSILYHWHEYVYIILAIVFIALYIFHFLPGDKGPTIKAILEADTVLMLVLIFVTVIAVRVEDISKGTNVRLDNIAILLSEVEKREGLARIQKIDSLTAYAAGLKVALQHTDSEVMLTSVWYEKQGQVSKLLQSAAGLFTELDQWSSQPDHTVYQIVGATNKETQQWFEAMCKKNGTLSNQVFRSLPWSSESPFINMVIFDDREVFLAFRKLQGHINQSEFYHIQSHEMTALMKHYFMALFDTSDKCPSFKPKVDN